jgi:hypothetical protein
VYSSVAGNAAENRETPEIFEKYLFAGPPMYLFVDKKGIIRYTQQGHCGNLEEKFDKIATALLAEKSS